MRRSALAALVMSALLTIPASGVLANGMEYVWGGGQIREGDNKVSFGADFNSGLEGTIQVNFHNLPVKDLDKSKFHSTSMTDFNWYPGDDPSCKSAMNATFAGRFNGEDGYKLIFRAGDGIQDTIRFELYGPGGEIYDTHDSGFTDESSCVGTARTSLDKGNITILP